MNQAHTMANILQRGLLLAINKSTFYLDTNLVPSHCNFVESYSPLA